MTQLEVVLEDPGDPFVGLEVPDPDAPFEVDPLAAKGLSGGLPRNAGSPSGGPQQGQRGKALPRTGRDGEHSTAGRRPARDVARCAMSASTGLGGLTGLSGDPYTANTIGIVNRCCSQRLSALKVPAGILGLLMASSPAFAEIRPELRIGVTYSPHRSYSQVKTSFPMTAGYPALTADLAGLEAAVAFPGPRVTHLVRAQAAAPARVSSDNGRGENYLLDPAASRFNRLSLGYGFEHRLFALGPVHFLRGPAVVLLCEGRILEYLSGQRETRWDVNIGIGPALAVEAALGPRLSLRGGLTGLFYLPHTSFGRLERGLPAVHLCGPVRARPWLQALPRREPELRGARARPDRLWRP